MNSINEKEKKLISVLDELKNLDLTNPKLQNSIENLSKQKNQLEIEKKEIEDKYRVLLEDHENLKKRIKDEKQSQRYKELKFNEKIDELNQETDTLLEEIDKWQM